MDFDEVRRLAIVALFSDDQLMEQLVLKGGNAISLVYGVSSRASRDLDFSLASDFPDLEDARRRIFRALKDRFDSAGYVVFDEILEPKPKLDGPDERPWWGGYELRFKLIERPEYERLKGRYAKMQVDAYRVGPHEQKTFSVDLSKYEFTEGKIERDLDFYKIYVYTLDMIAIEKLRAICQQMPEYVLKGNRQARARDFYDVYLIVTKGAVDLATPENQDLTRKIFAAKRVPLRFLGKIADYREFHRPDWQAVIESVPQEVEAFDFYFDFLLTQIERLKPLWEE
ncbi:MAG TPA: nucleotidyl transferase AbiEii/AbiGii toxin family protein [Terriglobia bacterium]|nr:nucleotidyl transferase AbiEii/AbiGii toxin family protein [Terriglobia bacterium]